MRSRRASPTPHHSLPFPCCRPRVVAAPRLTAASPLPLPLRYFDSIGHAIPPNTNPAEFFLDLVNNDFVAQEEVDTILDAWASRDKKNDAVVVPTSPRPPSNVSTPMSKQISVMMSRHAKLVYMDPVLYIGRAIIFLISNLYFALVYVKAREREQDQVTNKMWLIVWFIGVPANMGVVAVYAYNAE